MKNKELSKDVNESQMDIMEKTMRSFGRYQIFLCIVLFPTKFIVGINQLAVLFLAPKAKFVCADTRNSTCPCENIIYDDSVFSQTMITEWNLICGRQWLVSFNQMMVHFGTLIGSVIFGVISDKFGRKITMLLAVVLQLVSGVIAAFMTDYWLFTILRFLIGVSIGGILVVGQVLLMELIRSDIRGLVTTLYQSVYNFGYMILPLFAYFFRDRFSLQLALTAPSVFLLTYFLLIPESPRWLIADGKTEKAVTILKRMAKLSNKSQENIAELVETYGQNIKKNERKGNIVDLFRGRNIRNWTVIMTLNQMFSSYGFFGISQYVGQLSGNLFFNSVALGVVGFVGIVCTLPLMKILSRKAMCIAMNLSFTISFLLIIVVPTKLHMIFACVGEVCSQASFMVGYLYMTELFPTVVRNVAIGVATMMSRVGSMAAPFIIDLQVYSWWLPPVLLAAPSLISSLLVLTLPETKGRKLMTTIEDCE